MEISRSIRKVTLLFVALFIALSAGLVYWQVVVAQQVTNNPHNSRFCLPDSAPQRGRFLDRNGKVLADTIKVPYGCGYVRRYYDSSLAGLIGYYAGANYPATGLEHQFDNYLSGRDGMTALNNIINKNLHRPPVGDDIYLTIDENIQRIVNRDFDNPIFIDNHDTFASNRGSVIVTDPHTGEILAMLSRPSYDPNRLVQTLAKGDTTSYYSQLATDPDQPLIERPIAFSYVPGSTYKTMTLMAGIDSNNTQLNEQFDKDHALGPVFFPGSGHPVGPVGNNIEGYTFKFPVTTEYGYTHSDNIIFAQVGVKTGANTWLDYNRRFFVGKQIPFDLPVKPSTVLDNEQPLSIDTLAADAFGQGSDLMTPMQMSLIDNAAANDGQLMKPMLVSKILDPDGNPIQTNSPQSLGSQISAATAKDVRQAMYGVVRCGSGSVSGVKLVASPWGVIGKTGTAELGNSKPAHAWLITSAPYDINNPGQLPRLTIVAMKENGGEGGKSVGPMTVDMYNDIFTQVLKTPPPPQPDPNYCFKTGLLQ